MVLILSMTLPEYIFAEEIDSYEQTAEETTFVDDTEIVEETSIVEESEAIFETISVEETEILDKVDLLCDDDAMSETEKFNEQKTISGRFWTGGWYLEDGILTICQYSVGLNDCDLADYEQQIEKVIVEDGITRFSSEYGKYLKYVKEIVLPDTLCVIDNCAFVECRKLESIHIPESVQSIGWGAFRWCSSLKSVYFPNTMKVLDTGYMFDGCSSLESVHLPSCLQYIGESAFSYCKKLKNINLENIHGISCDAFFDCESLEEITLPDDFSSIIYSDSFNGCINLKSVVLPESVEKIEKYAFKNCRSLEHLVIKNVQVIENNAFTGCSAIKSAGPLGSGCDLEFSWTDSLPENAFRDFSNLTKVTLPETITSIGKNAFRNCKSLKYVVLPDNVTELCAEAFHNCVSLESICIPDDIQVIEDYTFFNCQKLKEVQLPVNLKKIDYAAFAKCDALKQLVFKCDAPVFDKSAFNHATLDVYYDMNNSTWTESVRQDYGGAINYIGYTAMDDNLIVKSVANKSGGIKIDWYTVLDAEKYVVEREEQDGKRIVLADIPATQETTYMDPTVQSGETYIYHIQAVDAVEATSQGVSEAILCLAKPQNVLASNNRSGVVFSWNPVPGASGYQVYRATSATGKYTKLATLTGNTSCKYVDKSVNDMKKYYYKVRAVASNKKKDVYGIFSVTDYVYYVAAPTCKSVESKQACIFTIKWAACDKAVRYEIQYSTSDMFTAPKVATSPATSTGKKISGLTKGKTYYVRVRVIKKVGSTERASGWSSIKSIKV